MSSFQFRLRLDVSARLNGCGEDEKLLEGVEAVPLESFIVYVTGEELTNSREKYDDDNRRRRIVDLEKIELAAGKIFFLTDFFGRGRLRWLDVDGC